MNHYLIRLLLTSVFLGGIIVGWAQSTTESTLRNVRMTQTLPGGTAKFESLGGTSGALETEFGSLTSNPAILGYNHPSHLTMTPRFGITKQTINFQNEQMQTPAYSWGINNLGMILSSSKGKADTVSHWFTFNFGGGFNQRYQSEVQNNFGGYRGTHSIGKDFQQEVMAEGGGAASKIKNKYPLSAGLALETGVIYPQSSDSTMYNSRLTGGVYQRHHSRVTSHIREWNLAFGTQYNEQLYFGVSLGFPFYRYTRRINYQEQDHHDTIPGFQSIKYKQQVAVEGEGANLKLGGIYELQDWLRLGLSAESPSFYALNEEYDNRLTFSSDSVGDRSEAASQEFHYNFLSPWRATLSISSFFQDWGYLSVNYEVKDYTTSTFYFSRQENQVPTFLKPKINTHIRDEYKITQQLRIGAGFTFQKYYIQGGYKFYKSPFTASDKKLQNYYALHGYSIGTGLKTKHVHLDFALTHHQSTTLTTPYLLTINTSEVITESRKFDLLLTLRVNL